mmetsp:Transcript_34047/g.47186  ORF Transcript_34047/g.47186 Transcript_34047/m.47186 type:complete len:256 (+) Transcript_34047:238-1005(+)
MIEGECGLLSGLNGIFAQFALAFVALLSLVLKRQSEKPRRPLNVWIYDVSKQAFAAAAAHGMGMVWAILVARYRAEEKASQCAWYLVVFTVDTTCGVALALYLHRLAVQAAARACQGELREGVGLQGWRGSCRPSLAAVAACGHYGDPPSLAFFLPQMGEFVMCVFCGRLACGLTVLTFAPLLGVSARLIDQIFRSIFAHATTAATAELWSVMVLGPLTMNVIQVLVQDAFLKFRGRHTQQIPLLDPFGSHSTDD